MIRLFFSLLLVSSPLLINSLPPNDFKWLKPFYILYETVTPEHWEKEPSMKPDKNGIITIKGNYNPVTIAQYALNCFDHYREKNDTSYRRKFLNQAAYFLSDTVLCEYAIDKVYYEYNYSFHDLKKGWTSGLAQAEVMSVLIRYYYVTRDNNVLPLIKKICNYMISPVEEGGCLLRTAEGGIWIEEYVGSKQHKHVLNGNMISLFSLYEYTNLFPDDKHAKRIYQDGLASLKQSVDFYDNGSWLKYDRGSKGSVANWYMKAQVVEMHSLYRITGDDFFYHKMMQWSTYCYEKPVGFIFCIVNDLNFASPMQGDSAEFKIKYSRKNLLNKNNVSSFNASPLLGKATVHNTFDNNLATFSTLNLHDSIKENPFVELTFTTPLKSDLFELLFKTSSSVLKVKSILYKSKENNWEKLRTYAQVSRDRNTSVMAGKAVDLSGLKIEFMKHDSLKQCELNELTLYKVADSTASEFVYHTTKSAFSENAKLVVDAKVKNSERLAVFIRTALSENLLRNQPWKFIGNKFPSGTSIEKGFYELMIVAKPQNTSFSITDFNVKKEVEK